MRGFRKPKHLFEDNIENGIFKMGTSKKQSSFVYKLSLCLLTKYACFFPFSYCIQHSKVETG